MTRPNLPDFKSPPVTEVALSIQFSELTSFQAVHLGLLWQVFGLNAFPKTEQHPPVPRMMERFGATTNPTAPQIELLNVPPVPRCFFISADGTEVIQVQNDRFTFNWIKRTERDVYPRFETVSEQFGKYANLFSSFLQERAIGDPKIELAEVTYVNRIQATDKPGQVEKIMSVYSGAFSDSFLETPEEVYMALRFPIRNSGEIVGRLYIDLRPDLSGVSGSPQQMTLLARGNPNSSDIKDAQKFFRLARQHIVSGFASVTSEEMHRVWERTDNA